MKNIIVVILFFTSLHVMGQFSMGPSVKYGWSDMPNDIESIRQSTDYTEFGPSYSIGILNEYKFKKWFSVELDILYDHLSSEKFYFHIKDNPNGYRNYLLTEVGYLTMPLLLQFDYKKLSLHVGGQVSYKVNEYLRFVQADPDNNQKVSEGRNGVGILNWNYGLTSSITYNVYQNFELEFRYIHGLSNIQNEKTGFVWYASTIQYLFGLNYKFDFQKKKTKEEAP